MPRRESRTPPRTPALDPARAAELLEQALVRAGQIAVLPYNAPEVRTFELTTAQILEASFPGQGVSGTSLVRAFAACFGWVSYPDMPLEEEQKQHFDRIQECKAVLKSALEQLQLQIPNPPVRSAPECTLHPEIERVSAALLHDGHYKQAALEAYIRVIEEVKKRSGVNLDGDKLMSRAFGCDNQVPILQINALSTDAERDEQRGFMNLFKGIVGLRNLKAHSNVLFSDPQRAHDYLSLASLLMRILEIAKVNKAQP